MLSNKFYVLVLAAAGLACLFWAHQRTTQNRTRNSAHATVAELNNILNAPASSSAEVQPEAIRRSQFEDVNESYRQLKMRKRSANIPGEPLIKLAECLRSQAADLRAHCQDLSLNMLSDWTFNRAEGEWHSKPEVDAFFRVFKVSNYPELEHFLYHRAVNYEQKYLSQI
jgi:hypothetical protein